MLVLLIPNTTAIRPITYTNTRHIDQVKPKYEGGASAPPPPPPPPPALIIPLPVWSVK